MASDHPEITQVLCGRGGVEQGLPANAEGHVVDARRRESANHALKRLIDEPEITGDVAIERQAEIFRSVIGRRPGIFAALHQHDAAPDQHGDDDEQSKNGQGSVGRRETWRE